MPIHDWRRVIDGTFHDFHLSWVSQLSLALNTGLLLSEFYSLVEQQGGHSLADGWADELSLTTELNCYVTKRRTIVVRHERGDRIIALIEIVSPGTRASDDSVRSFLKKAADSLNRGYHLLVIDLFPPGPRDPQGLHGAIWSEICDHPFELPPGEPLTLAAYSAGQPKHCYVEPTAVGRALSDMPLFLDPETYVNVPLEATYQAAYRGVPQRWRRVLE